MQVPVGEVDPPHLDHLNTLIRRSVDLPSLHALLSWTDRGKGLVLLNVLVLLCASNWVIVKEAEAASADPEVFTALRFGVAALAFTPWLASGLRDRGTVIAGLELGLWSALGYLTQAEALLSTVRENENGRDGWEGCGGRLHARAISIPSPNPPLPLSPLHTPHTHTTPTGRLPRLLPLHLLRRHRPRPGGAGRDPHFAHHLGVRGSRDLRGLFLREWGCAPVLG